MTTEFFETMGRAHCASMPIHRLDEFYVDHGGPVDYADTWLSSLADDERSAWVKGFLDVLEERGIAVAENAMGTGFHVEQRRAVLL